MSKLDLHLFLKQFESIENAKSESNDLCGFFRNDKAHRLDYVVGEKDGKPNVRGFIDYVALMNDPEETLERFIVMIRGMVL